MASGVVSLLSRLLPQKVAQDYCPFVVGDLLATVISQPQFLAVPFQLLLPFFSPCQ